MSSFPCTHDVIPAAPSADAEILGHCLLVATAPRDTSAIASASSARSALSMAQSSALASLRNQA